MGRAALVFALFLACLVTACGDAAPVPTPTATATATATLTPEPTLSATPRPTSTPYPTATRPPPSGRVITRLIVSCELGPYGLELRVRYGSSVTDTENAAATITRAIVYVDGMLREDSGPLSHVIYAREVTFRGVENRRHIVQLHVETWAAPQPTDFVQFVLCPSVPDTPRI